MSKKSYSNSYRLKDIVIAFTEKTFVRGRWIILGPTMIPCRNSGSTLRILFLVLHNERGQEVHQNYINAFSQKNSCLRQMGHFEYQMGILLVSIPFESFIMWL